MLVRCPALAQKPIKVQMSRDVKMYKMQQRSYCQQIRSCTPEEYPQSGDLNQVLFQCEVEGNSVKAIETLMEARVFETQLTLPARESAIRCLAQGENRSKALELISDMLDEGHKPSKETLQLIFQWDGQGSNPLQLFQRIIEQHPDLLTDELENLVICSYAKSGEVEQAKQMLEDMLNKKKRVETKTFNTMAIHCAKAGDLEYADQVLEYRDYL